MDNSTNNVPEDNHLGHNDVPRRPSILWPIITAISVVAVAVLGINAHHLSGDLSALQASTQSQIAKLNDQLAQMGDESKQRLESVAQEAHDSAASASQKAQADLRRTNAALSAKLAAEGRAEQQAQEKVAGALEQLKQASDSASSKLNELSGDVTGVKGDVSSTQSDLQETGSQLRRVTGDMGVMSDRIATNAKELGELRELGERDYLEFDLKRNGGVQKLGGIQLALAKADPKRNRFTLNVLADDKRTEKRDRTINEPVQLYVAGSHQPYEIVVNDVKKDEVVGYLAVPKVKMARR